MTTVLSNKNDINTLAQLWKQGFGDSASFIDWYFSNRYAEDLSSVTKDGEEIVSMAFLSADDCQNARPRYPCGDVKRRIHHSRI